MDLALIARVLLMRRTLRAREQWTSYQTAAYRTEQLRLLRAHAYTHSPFYRTFHAGVEAKALRSFPF